MDTTCDSSTTEFFPLNVNSGYFERKFQLFWPHLTWILFHLHGDKEPRRPLGKLSLPYIISQLVYFDEHPDTAKDIDFAVEAKNTILSQYNNGEIHSPFINSIFERVKSEGWEVFKEQYDSYGH